ncbi:MAG TPA: glycosyltransferase family 4 protein [Spirochaetota bacterium]|nr:glycosyltransferase family 4 protein [Spirochaetota bacterium]
MNILHIVEHYYPFKSGMSEVVKQISENLTDFGHKITVATGFNPERKTNLINGVKIEEFNISGNWATGFIGSQIETSRYIDFVLNGNFDIVTLFAAQQWGTDLILPLLNKIKGKKVFVPTGFSGLYIPMFNEYFKNMKEWIRQFDCSVFLSNDYKDINFAKENNVSYDKIVVIPNGASKKDFLTTENIEIKNKLSISPNDFLIISVGGHTALKGHKEAIKIFEKSKIKNCVFVIVGNKIEKQLFKINFKNIIKLLLFSFFKRNIGLGCQYACKHSEKKFNKSILRLFDKKKLIITDLTREETLALYKIADIFLFPSNIECSPIVLFESCASQTPFLTSDVGNSKEIIEWTEGGILLPTKKDKKGYSYAEINKSAKILENICKDKDLRENLKKRGFENWSEKFTWEEISKKYESLYLTLTSKQSR